MKKKVLGTTALLAILAANFALPITASAVPTSLKSEGHIEYIEDNGTNPPTDPEDPGKPVDPEEPIVVNPDGGTLSVDAVTNLEFMKQKAVTTDQTYFAKQVTVKENGAAKGTRGNFVQVTDKRIDNRTAWKLSAKMTKQFTAGTNVLAGSTLTYTNPLINGAGTDKDLFPKLGTGSSSFTLTESGNEVDVMATDAATKGFGTFTVEFGNSAGYAGGTATDSTGTPNATDANLIENGSVQLFVPGKAIKTKAAYTAEVLWSISETP